ncbi:MAG TPA: aminotransferase class I/II-fold pyridoxal phosphate-dependent enzyme, partial [Cellvibrio sp.]
PIQPIIVGSEAKTLVIAEKLAARGILIIAIRPPTVPAGSSRLRITFSAQHSIAHVDQLLNALGDVMSGLPNE